MRSEKIKICLTGGPCAGKTTIIEFIRREFQDQALAIPEAASILYKGGFPRFSSEKAIKAAQRAIYFTQIEMEAVFQEFESPSILFCDRGTLDHPAYWPDSPKDFFEAVASSAEKEASRYDLVIHLQSASAEHGYEFQNSVRKESPEEALKVDNRILDSWACHPNRIVIASRISFHDKVDAVFEAIHDYIRYAKPDRPFEIRDSRTPSLFS